MLSKHKQPPKSASSPGSGWLPFLGVSDQHEKNPITLLRTAHFPTEQRARPLRQYLREDDGLVRALGRLYCPFFLETTSKSRQLPSPTGLSSNLCSSQGAEISGGPLSRPSYNHLWCGTCSSQELPIWHRAEELSAMLCAESSATKPQWTRPSLVSPAMTWDIQTCLIPFALASELKTCLSQDWSGFWGDWQ